ncbi:COG1470 family protein [Chitinophaga alhagiae]|uniref:COG1470 family protein n=1 Tax=Chitinophaga alhagiae TaxID=2203219 RepID=UPI0018E553D0|nr:NEW3 domain-containing protein [Chitinophaga alhagiae]
MAQTNSPSSPPFTVRLMNIEAAGNATFTYNARLQNVASSPRIYQLSAAVPPGWNVSFKVEGIQVTSLSMEPQKGYDIIIDVHPAIDVKPGKYPIPVRAVASADSLKLDLEAVVKGSYGLTLTTPTGRLSADVTEGRRKEIRLQVKNTGTMVLENIDLSAQAPPQWEATFAPSAIARLDPGKDAEVTATLNVPDKTIAGDYVTNFTAKNANATSSASFRMTVKTSVLTGWLGLLVILAALGAVYYLIRKYGRR